MLNLIQRIDNIDIFCKDEILSKYNNILKGIGKFPGNAYHLQ